MRKNITEINLPNIFYMCKHENAIVLDVRERRRRRICRECGERFTKYEISPEEYEVVKKYYNTIRALKLFVGKIEEIQL